MMFISIYTQQLDSEALFNMNNIIFIDEPSRAVRFVGGEVYHTNEEGIEKLLVAARGTDYGLNCAKVVD